MKRAITRKLSSIAGCAALAAGLLVGTAAPASASPCSGSRVGTYSIDGGRIEIWYNSSTGYNCALTYTSNPGVSQYIYVGLGVSGTSTWRSDSGTYQYYAGPVSVYAKGKCIDFLGQVGNGAKEGMTYAHCG